MLVTVTRLHLFLLGCFAGLHLAFMVRKNDRSVGEREQGKRSGSSEYSMCPSRPGVLGIRFDLLEITRGRKDDGFLMIQSGSSPS